MENSKGIKILMMVFILLLILNWVVFPPLVSIEIKERRVLISELREYNQLFKQLISEIRALSKEIKRWNEINQEFIDSYKIEN